MITVLLPLFPPLRSLTTLPRPLKQPLPVSGSPLPPLTFTREGDEEEERGKGEDWERERKCKGSEGNEDGEGTRSCRERAGTTHGK